MTDFAPTADLRGIGFTPSAGATITGTVDEAVTDDADYAEATVPGSYVDMALPVTALDATNTIKWRACSPAADRGLTVELREWLGPALVHSVRHRRSQPANYCRTAHDSGLVCGFYASVSSTGGLHDFVSGRKWSPQTNTRALHTATRHGPSIGVGLVGGSTYRGWYIHDRGMLTSGNPITMVCVINSLGTLTPGITYPLFGRRGLSYGGLAAIYPDIANNKLVVKCGTNAAGNSYSVDEDFVPGVYAIAHSGQVEDAPEIWRDGILLTTTKTGTATGPAYVYDTQVYYQSQDANASMSLAYMYRRRLDTGELVRKSLNPWEVLHDVQISYAFPTVLRASQSKTAAELGTTPSEHNFVLTSGEVSSIIDPTKLLIRAIAT